MLRAWCARHGVCVVRMGRRSTVRLDRLYEAFDRAAGETTPHATWNEDEIIARAITPNAKATRSAGRRGTVDAMTRALAEGGSK